MIVALLAWTVATLPQVVELPTQGATVAVVAVVRAEPRGAWEAAALRVLAEAMKDGTREFTRLELTSYGAQAGVPLRVEAMPDHLAVRVSAPKKGGLDAAMPLVASLLTSPLLEDEAVQNAVARLDRPRDVWQSMLDPVDLPYSKVTPKLVRNVASRFLRPENTTVAVAGAFEAGDGKRAVEGAFSEWRPGQAPAYDAGGAIRPLLQRSSGPASVELAAPPLPRDAAPAEHATRMASAFALGVGKDGTLHRMLRDTMGWSYRQEAVWWPTVSGWHVRLLAALGADAKPGDAATIRAALLKDVEAWNEATLVRARALAERALTVGLEVTPVWWSLAGPEVPDAQGEASWMAIAQCAGFPGVTRAAVLRELPGVTLEGLKRDAKSLVEGARAGFVLGAPSAGDASP